MIPLTKTYGFLYAFEARVHSNDDILFIEELGSSWFASDALDGGKSGSVHGSPYCIILFT
jgi:hypothetical protein